MSTELKEDLKNIIRVIYCYIGENKLQQIIELIDSYSVGKELKQIIKIIKKEQKEIKKRIRECYQDREE